MPKAHTTVPVTRAMIRPVLTEETHGAALELARQIRFRIVKLYYARVGPEWSSQGREESDVFHHVHLACGGMAQLRHQGEVIELRAGSAYFFTGNTPIERITARDYTSYVLKFRCESQHGADPLLDWPSRGPRRLPDWDPKQKNPASQALSADINTCLALYGQLAIWLAEAFPDLDKIVSHHHQTFARYGRVFEMIERQLAAQVRIADLAHEYGTTPHAFSIAFTRDTGMSPKAYINRRLNQEACRLILGTNLPLKEIARTLGFADEYYFSRFFLKMNGVRPRKFRQTSLGGAVGAEG